MRPPPTSHGLYAHSGFGAQEPAAQTRAHVRRLAVRSRYHAGKNPLAFAAKQPIYANVAWAVVLGAGLILKRGGSRTAGKSSNSRLIAPAATNVLRYLQRPLVRTAG